MNFINFNKFCPFTVPPEPRSLRQRVEVGDWVQLCALTDEGETSLVWARVIRVRDLMDGRGGFEIGALIDGNYRNADALDGDLISGLTIDNIYSVKSISDIKNRNSISRTLRDLRSEINRKKK